MKKNNNSLIGFIVLLVIIGGVFLWLRWGKSAEVLPSPQEENVSVTPVTEIDLQPKTKTDTVISQPVSTTETISLPSAGFPPRSSN